MRNEVGYGELGELETELKWETGGMRAQKFYIIAFSPRILGEMYFSALSPMSIHTFVTR